MSRRQSFLAYAALLVGVISIASTFARPTPGQQPIPAPAQVGRYQMAVGGSYGTVVYVIDTATGKIWNGSAVGGEMYWAAVKSPPYPK